MRAKSVLSQGFLKVSAGFAILRATQLRSVLTGVRLCVETVVKRVTMYNTAMSKCNFDNHIRACRCFMYCGKENP